MAIRLERASFKGDEFFWRSGSLEEGQKTVVHEFPNTNRRVIEDLGILQGTFTIQGITHGFGSDYKRNRDALREALATGGDGILKHPLYGSMIVKAQVYTLTEDSKSLGQASFEMVFKRSDNPSFPTSTGNRFTLLNNAVLGTIAAIAADIADRFAIVTGVVENVQDAFARVDGMADEFLELTRVITEPIDDFTAQIGQVKDSIGVLIATPDLLGGSITGMFTAFQSLGSSSTDQFNLNRGFYSFGDENEPLEYDTGAAIERERNAQVLNLAAQASSLAYNYGLVREIDFVTENELDGIRQDLEDQYDAIADSLSNEVVEAIEECRSLASQILEQTEINIFRIVTTDTNPIPVGVLTYAFYGDLENEQTLIELNDVIDSSRVDGEFLVFSR